MRPVLSLLAVLFLSIPAAAQPLIVIDAGHGGTDPGAVGCSLQEADVVLDTAQRLQVLLEAAGVRIAMTRDDDTFVGLSARAAFANSMGADGFVSLHSNANSGTPATGSETFVYPGSGARTRELGQGIQDAILDAWMLSDRGLKEANFAVLRETTMPAALGELAFTNRCDPDAMLLGDPAARQRMAEHQRDAVLRWLGIDPTMPTTGVLRGVVFEDQGVGDEDITVRLAGASVTIVESGATATASTPDADWSFDVMPGTYTVEAARAGHVTGSRSCTVTSGATTWCSVGLFAEASGSDAGTTTGEDAGTTTGEDAAAGSDAGEGREPVGSCGCRAASRAGAPWWTMAIGIAIAIAATRRRAAPVAVACVAVVATAAGCGHDPSRAEAPIVAGGGAAVIASREIAAYAELGAAREWLAPGYASPLLSPDGAHVLVASDDHRALFVADLAGDDGFREVCRVGRCGWEPRWQDGGAAIAYRIDGQSATAVPGAAVALDGSGAVAVRVGRRGVHAWIDEDDRAHLRIADATRAISPEGERVMMPSITADERHVVVWSLTRGVLVHRIADGTTIRVGEGGHPRVDPSGRWLVLERTEEDGHAITRGDLWIVDLEDPGASIAPLLVTPDRIERMPTLSRIGVDGRGVLAYLDGGALIVRDVVLARR